MSAMQFKKATRKNVKLKILLQGPSGSGKTIGALELAKGLAAAGDGRVAVIDSEKDRSEYYADRYEFDKLSLDDLRCQAYGQAIQVALDAGYGVIVLDSLSHAWLELLDRKERYDAAHPSTNKWTNWGMFTPEWEKLIRFILECPAHVICSARSKQAHEQVEDGGRKKVVKLGLAPQLRENTEYEFALSIAISESHYGEATKDNTGLFGDKSQPINLLDGTVAKRLLQWVSSGAVEVNTTKPVTNFANTPDTVSNTTTPSPTQTPAPARQQKPAPAPAASPLTLAAMKERFAKAKFKTGEDLGAATNYIITNLPSVSSYTPEKIDILEHVRQECGIHVLATENDFWKHWSPDMLEKGKFAVGFWLGQVKG